MKVQPWRKGVRWGGRSGRHTTLPSVRSKTGVRRSRRDPGDL